MILGSLTLAVQDVANNKTVLETIPNTWPHQTDLLLRCQEMTPGVAAALILVGVVYLLFGFKIFKALVMLNAGVVGGCLGAMALGAKGEAAIAAAIIGAFLAAAITWPTMKYAVAIMGGIFGMVLGASIWATLDLDPHLVWAGALTGLVALGMLSFILFKGSVMMYTSLQGSFMLVFGILGLLFKYNNVTPQVLNHLNHQSFVLPAAIFIPAVIGLIYQHHNTTGHAGGGGGGGGKK